MPVQRSCHWFEIPVHHRVHQRSNLLFDCTLWVRVCMPACSSSWLFCVDHAQRSIRADLDNVLRVSEVDVALHLRRVDRLRYTNCAIQNHTLILQIDVWSHIASAQTWIVQISVNLDALTSPLRITEIQPHVVSNRLVDQRSKFGILVEIARTSK